MLLVDSTLITGGHYCESCIVSGSDRGRSTSTGAPCQVPIHGYKYCVYTILGVLKRLWYRSKQDSDCSQLPDSLSSITNELLQRIVNDEMAGSNLAPQYALRERANLANCRRLGSNLSHLCIYGKFPEFSNPTELNLRSPTISHNLH